MRATAAAMILVTGLSVTAQAAEPQTLTLACKGTETSQASRAADTGAAVEQINIGVMVDYQRKRIFGLSDSPLTISNVDETTITFTGSDRDWFMNGTIDRVTGSLLAHSRQKDPFLLLSYDLQCKPTQRMF
jgi:hypothetical protein